MFLRGNIKNRDINIYINDDYIFNSSNNHFNALIYCPQFVEYCHSFDQNFEDIATGYETIDNLKKDINIINRKIKLIKTD